MRRLIGAIGVLAVLGYGSMSPPAAAQSQSEDYNWNGFYGGGNLGGGFGGSDFLSSLGRGVPFFEGEFYEGSNPAVVARLRDAYQRNSGSFGSFTGGIQAGYNFRSGGMVYGLEADINLLSAKSSKKTSVLGDPTIAATGAATYSFHSEVDASYIASLRPRVGMLFNNTLLYATGGLAVTTLHYKHDFRGTGGFFANPPPSIDITEHASTSATKLGWTVGGGIEMPVSQTMTVRTEYLFTQFDSVTANNSKINPLDPSRPGFDAACGANTGQGGAPPFTFLPAVTPRQCFDHKANLLLHSIRLGVNFKF